MYPANTVPVFNFWLRIPLLKPNTSQTYILWLMFLDYSIADLALTSNINFGLQRKIRKFYYPRYAK
jgi:hypothetical protein